MTIEIHWQSLDAAAQKYGIEKKSLLAWVEEGIVRSEAGPEGGVRVNVDDLELKIHEVTKL